MKHFGKLLLLAMLASSATLGAQQPVGATKLSVPTRSGVVATQAIQCNASDMAESDVSDEGEEKEYLEDMPGVPRVSNPSRNVIADARASSPARSPIETNEKVTRYRWVDKSIVAAEGTATNQYVPVYCYYLDNATCHGQMIYPSSMLADLAGKRIKSITFYSNSALSVYSNSTTQSKVTLKLGETASSTYSSTTFITSGLSAVSTVAQLLNGGTEITFDLADQYIYQGGNLVVDVSGDGSGSAYAASSVAWKGTNDASSNTTSLYAYSSNSAKGASFLPQIKIEYEGKEAYQADAPVSGDKEFFSQFEYTWPINIAEQDRPDENKATLDQIATDPDQIIAMLRKVYMDKSIPGNWKRGYAANGCDEPYNDVAYTGVGAIDYTGSGTTAASYGVSDNYRWSDAGYGWNVPGDIIAHTGTITPTTTSAVYYAHMDSTQYKPDQEGVTLLLVEMRDDYTTADLHAYVRAAGASTDYERLRAYISYAIKSVRVVTQSKRTGSGFDAGTLFKIDCDKMNKFYLIAKGQLRYPFNSNRVFASGSGFYSTQLFCRLPLYAYSENFYYKGDEANGHGGFLDYNVGEEFGAHMFEQFSPYNLSEANDVTDIYADLVNMESFAVPHDCITVPTATPAATEAGGHFFRMYGDDSGAEDCQDVRDLMFFVPDYRMLSFEGEKVITTKSLTLADGSDGSTTTTSEYLPIWGYNYDDNSTRGQMIYPSSMLAGLAGKKIKSITFYPSSSIAFSGGALTVTMGTTSSSNFTSASALTPSNAVSKVIYPTSGDTEMTITFDDDFTYQSGDNLLIDAQVSSTGEYGSTDWQGITTSDYQSYVYCGSSNYGGKGCLYFLPTMKVTYEEETTEGATRDIGNGVSSVTGNNYSAQAIKYQNYNPAHQPTMALFVIKQDAIPEGEVVSSDATTMTGLYKHQLKWRSNLDNFLPGGEQEYELWELVVDEFGVESYQPVYYRNASGDYTDAAGTVLPESQRVAIVLDRQSLSEFVYTDVYVDMTAGSQTKTYVIRGRDKEGFLSLQTSNQQEIVIPGLDPNEKARLIGATYYSRFNPQTELNCYSNKLEMKNNAEGLTAADLSGKTLNFYRSSRAAQVDGDGNVVTDEDGNILYVDNSEETRQLVATGTLSGNTLSVTMQNQAEPTLFPAGKTDVQQDKVEYYAGYHANGDLTFTVTTNRDGYLDFGTLYFWDNFVADVSKNAHPLQYLYKVEVGQAYSNDVRVPVYKTDSRVDKMTLAQVLGDTGYNPDYTPGDVEFNAKVQLSGKSEILRYDAYRWNESEERYIVDEVNGVDDEQDLPPTGMAGNQGEFYTVTMNDVNDPRYYYVAGTDGQPVVNTTSPTAWATFVDYYPTHEETEAGAYTYAPVVELFTKGYNATNKTLLRDDYNTYGGPLQTTAVGKLEVVPYEPTAEDTGSEMALMSDYKWQGSDGEWYSYYNILLNFTALGVPEDYELYKVRAWRKVDDKSILGETLQTRQGRADYEGDWYLYEDINFGDALNAGDSPSQMSKTQLKNTNFYLGQRSTDIAVPTNPDGTGGGKLFEDEQGEWAYGDSQNDAIHGETRATFGAKRLTTNALPTDFSTMTADFKVRAYFTKKTNPLISGETPQDPGTTYDPVYVLGSNNNWNPSEAIATLNSTDGKTYTGTVTFSGEGLFSFTNQLGATFGDIWNHRLGVQWGTYDAEGSVDAQTGFEYTLMCGGEHTKSFKIPAGTYNLTLTNYTAGTYTYLQQDLAKLVISAPAAAAAPRRAGEAARMTGDEFDYYVAEGETTFSFTSTGDNVITGITGVKADRSRDVLSVTFVNPMGQQSSRPFDGVNMVVTRYSDGTVTTTKVMR